MCLLSAKGLFQVSPKELLNGKGQTRKKIRKSLLLEFTFFRFKKLFCSEITIPKLDIMI